MGRSLKIGLAAFAVGLFTTPAVAQLRVAPPQDIADATGSCVLASRPGSVDTARLSADGWQLATVSATGKPVTSPLRVHSRKGSAVLLTTTVGTEADGLCVVMARIDKIGRFSDVERALVSRLDARPIQRKPGETIFVVGRSMVSLVLSGNSDKPATRISVIQMLQEKK